MGAWQIYIDDDDYIDDDVYLENSNAKLMTCCSQRQIYAIHSRPKAEHVTFFFHFCEMHHRNVSDCWLLINRSFLTQEL